MAVRRALVEDIEAMVGIMVTVAEEGSIATEPPAEPELLRKRFRETIEGPTTPARSRSTAPPGSK